MGIGKMLDHWLYFGCPRGSIGHYLRDERGNSPREGYGEIAALLAKWDGVLPPHPERESDLYRATVTRVPGLGFSAIAWWDRSADSRLASNSAIYAPHPEAGPDWLIEEGERRFPFVFRRLPRPLELWAAPR